MSNSDYVSTYSACIGIDFVVLISTTVKINLDQSRANPAEVVSTSGESTLRVIALEVINVNSQSLGDLIN
jgi:hypothetical protein